MEGYLETDFLDLMKYQTKQQLLVGYNQIHITQMHAIDISEQLCNFLHFQERHRDQLERKQPHISFLKVLIGEKRMLSLMSRIRVPVAHVGHLLQLNRLSPTLPLQVESW